MGGSTHAGRPSVDLPEVVLAALAPSVAAHVREAIRRGDYTAADVVGAGEWSDGGDVVVCDVDDGGGRDDTPRMDEDTSDEGNVQCVKCVNVPPRAATPSDDDDEDEVLLAAVLGAIVKRDAAVDTRAHASTTASAQTAAVVSDAGAQTAAVSSAARPIVASTPSYHPFDDIAAALERRAKVGPKNTLGGSAPRLMAGKGKRPPPDSSAASGHAADDPGCEPNYDAVRRRVPACRFGTPPPRPTPIQPATPPKARQPRTPADRVAPTEVGLPFETGMDAAIADLEAKEREEAEAGRRARATLDPEKLDVVRRKPPATTFARAAGGEKTKRQTSPLRSASETAVSTTQTAVNFALVEPSAPALSFGRSSGRDGAVGLEEGARAAMESSASSDAWWRRPFGKTNQRAPRGSPSRALPDPGAIARALAATRPSASSALGVVRWAPARPPSSPGGVSVASTMSTESADWDGRTVARELRRRAAAESRAAAANRSADRPRVGPLPNDEPCRPRVVTPPAWGPPPKKKTDDAAAAKAKAAARAKAEAKKAAREARREAAETDGMFDPYGVDDDDDDDAAALTWRTSSTEVSRVDAAPAPPVPSDVVTRRRSPAVRFAPPPRRADDDDRAAIRSLREGAVGPGTYHRAAGADVAVRKRAPEVSFGARPITAPRASARRDASGGGGVYDADGAAWDAAKGKRVKGVVAFDRAPPRKTAAEEAAENKNTSGGVTKTDPVHVLTEPRVIGGAWAPAPPNTVEPKSDAVDASTLQSELDLDAAAAWDRHVAPSKPAWRFGEAPTDRGGGVGRGQSDTVPWPVLGLDTWSDRALPSGGAVAFDAMIGRADGYEDRRAAREAANHRAPVVGTYKVVEAIDYLRRATPAAVFRLAADRWRASRSKRRRKCDKEEEKEEEEEEDEGPDWLTHEALAAAVNQTRPTAPGWRFLPLAVTQPRPAPGRTPKPGERPELEVRLTLVRKRPPSAPDFSKRPSEDRRDAPASPGRAAALGPGAYDVDYALTEPTPVTVGFSALDRGLLPALDEGETEEGGGPSKEASRSVGEGDALDIDPAAAFATAVARRAGAGAHVDIARMTNPRVDDEKRREARAVAAAGLDAEHGWERVLDDGDGEGSDAASVVREVMAAATAKAARALQPLTAADKLGDPDADLPTRRRLEGGVDFATMTWRVGETSEGRLSLELLSARLGPGAYDASDETTTARRRAPGPADFAKGAARFSHDRYSEDDSDPTNPEDTSGRRTGAFAVDPEGDRVWLDLASAVAAVRPRVDVGGVIHPEHTSGMSDERREPLPYVDAVYDVERALEILRDGAYARAPDFASALNPRAAATAETSADAAGRNPAAPDFYDVDTETALGALAYPRGAGGSTAWGAPSFAPAVGRGEAFYLDAATLRRQEGVADGDRLELDPATADAKTRPRVDKGVLDMSEAAQTGRPEETAPALTSDVDWLYERQLAAAYPRLDAGTGAVDFSKSTAQVRRGVGADAVNRTTDDLDAGCYHDDVSRVDAKAAVTTRRRARAADFSTASGRDAGGTSGGGDVLVLNPRDPWRAPETALEASKAAAIAASDPVAAFKAQVFVRATPRWAHAPADDAGGEGDVLVLPVPHPSGGRRSDVDGHDFGRPAGRGAVFGVGGWTSERVGHALRADPRVPTREGADSEENRGDPEAWRVERRKERVARMMARLPRRGVGAPKPAGDGGGHRRVVIE